MSVRGGREVSVEVARRTAIRAQLLDGSAGGALDTVRALGFLQLDPVSTVVTPQERVLWSRLPLLVGDFLVGRVEPVLDRQAGVLRVVGEWGDTSRADEALASLATFLGAELEPLR